jgi:hypothetical protein
MQIKNPNFHKLTLKQQNRIIDYAETIYTDLNAQLGNWNRKRNNPNTVRSITHGNYDRIHTCSVPSGLVSEESIKAKRNNKNFVFCKDHCYRPQFMIMMFMDEHDKFLSDYNVFLEYLIISCTTILITPEENEILKKFTQNKNGKIKIKVPTDKIYQEANIKLFNSGKGRGWWSKDLDEMSNYLETPQPYLNYEKNYLVN